MTLKRIISSIFLIILLTLTKSFSQTNKVPNKNLLDSITAAVKQGAYPNIDAIIISHKGKISYEKYFNDLTKDSLHDSRSSFKSITGLLTGIAIDKGFIKSVNEKVYSFFQYKQYNNWDSRKDSMTFKDLLEMKSGYDCEEWNDSKDCEDEMTKSNDWIKFSLDLPLSHSPGTFWAYTSGIVDNDSVYRKCYQFIISDKTDSSSIGLIHEAGLTGGLKESTLKQFMISYLNSKGRLYSINNFFNSKPGKHYNYSNIASALAAYLIEIKSQISFSEFTNKYIFQPLKMGHSTWFVSINDLGNRAVPYYNADTSFPFITL